MDISDNLIVRNKIILQLKQTQMKKLFFLAVLLIGTFNFLHAQKSGEMGGGASVNSDYTGVSRRLFMGLSAESNLADGSLNVKMLGIYSKFKKAIGYTILAEYSFPTEGVLGAGPSFMLYKQNQEDDDKSIIIQITPGVASSWSYETEATKEGKKNYMVVKPIGFCAVYLQRGKWDFDLVAKFGSQINIETQLNFEIQKWVSSSIRYSREMGAVIGFRFNLTELNISALASNQSVRFEFGGNRIY